MATGEVVITELSESGSVPELRVTNRSCNSLLILDGEELVGAKQNRVVNSTLLLSGESQTTIPVSCVEQGRWRSNSTSFQSSEAVMEMKLRRSKVRNVSDALHRGDGHSSEQAEVWAQIQALQSKAAHQSCTSAMNEVFKARARELQVAIDRLPCHECQHGLLVSIKGRMAGCDLLSRSAVYQRLHAKLIRSYVLDPLLEEPGQPDPDESKARAFLGEVGRAQPEFHASVGLGTSIRFRNPTVAGAAVSHDSAVVHLAAFDLRSEAAPAGCPPGMQTLKQRRQQFPGRRGDQGPR